MGPKDKHPSTGDLFQQPLAELINLKHPLVKLAELIDWSVFETRWAEFWVRRQSESPADNRSSGFPFGAIKQAGAWIGVAPAGRYEYVAPTQCSM